MSVDEKIKYKVRSYNHQVLELTDVKQDTLLTILTEYRRIANIMVKRQFVHFYKFGSLSEQSKDFYGNINTFLSERYKDVIKRQVDGMIKSYISNRKNDFIKCVHKSSLSKDERTELLKINKRNEWFLTENTLARKVFKHILSKNRKPSTKHLNMVLNTKVYDLEKNTTTKLCSYHIRLRTCNEEKNVILPLKTNTYFQEKLTEAFKINNSIQLNFNKNNKLKHIVLSTETPITYNYVARINVMAIDFGLTSMFTNNLGERYSRDFYKKLKHYDDKLQKLTNELKKRDKNCKLSQNKRYEKLTKTIRAYIKNETNRVLNKMVKNHSPERIIAEDLNFQNTNLGKQLNRILSNCGISNIKNKLESLSVNNGIVIEFVNPAYTSQECNVCGFTHKDNRKTQSKFKCLYCDLEIHADVNSPRTIINRINDGWFASNKYAKLGNIKLHLDKVFCDRHSSLSSFVKVKDIL